MTHEGLIIKNNALVNNSRVLHTCMNLLTQKFTITQISVVAVTNGTRYMRLA